MKRLLLFLLIIACVLLCSCELLPAVTSSSSTSSVKVIDIQASYTATKGGSISGEVNQVASVNEGESFTFQPVTAVAESGYKFTGWSDGVTTPTRTDTLTQSTSVSASFVYDGLISIQYVATQGGRIEGNASQRVAEGVLGEQVVAVADEGHVFLGWDDGIDRERRTDVAKTDKIYTARFKEGYRVTFTCNEVEGEIGGYASQAVSPNTKFTVVYANPKPGYRFVKWSTGHTTNALQLTVNEEMHITAYFERVDLELPVLYIETEGHKSVFDQSYINCGISVENAKDEYNFAPVAGKIRGRGNTSFQVAKCSYKIKFDRAVELFGNPSSREWTLISNHFDLSLVRNYLAYSVAGTFDRLDSTTSMQFVDLYINGEYRGVYLVCEQVEAGKDRVEISTDVSSVDTGYLIELDDRLDGAGFYVGGQFYGLKDPDTESYQFTPEHMAFISAYVSSCVDAINGTDYAKIESLIDTRSFAQAYIVFELFHCYDVGFSSFFMHKDAGGKLVCGPVWDFDRSVGNVGNNYSSRNPEYLFAKNENAWFSALLRHEEFKALVGTILHEHADTIRATISSCCEYVESCKGAFDRNFEKWDNLGGYIYPNPSELNKLQTWWEHIEFNQNWLERSLTYMLTQYPSS